MIKIFKSEWLKQRKNTSKKFLIIAPGLSILIAILLVGPSIIESFSIYWWEAVFLYTLIGLLFLYDYKAEEAAGNFQNIYFRNDSVKIYIVKILLKLKDLLISNVWFLAILLFTSNFLYADLISLNIIGDLICLVLISITSIWVLPLLYLFSKWINPYILVSINSLICFLVAPFIAQSSFWFFLPFTYHYKIAYSLMYIKPSGDLDLTNHVTDVKMVVFAVFLSLILFIVSLLMLNWRLSNDPIAKK